MKEESQRWLQLFVEKRGLKSPDGRELYRYRAEEQEFLAVEAVLRKWLAAFPQNSSLAQLADDPQIQSFLADATQEAGRGAVLVETVGGASCSR